MVYVMNGILMVFNVIPILMAPDKNHIISDIGIGVIVGATWNTFMNRQQTHHNAIMKKLNDDYNQLVLSGKQSIIDEYERRYGPL